MRLIDADKFIEKLKEHKSLFCKNRVEFIALSDKDKARVDEIDTCIAELVNAEEVPHAQLGTNLAEVGTDCISRQAAIDALNEQIEQCDKALSSFDISMKDAYAVKVERATLVAYKEQLEFLPSVQPERTCVNCGRTANNGGWYVDGGTRCPIEEHYALPKDGFCHLWEKRNVTDDDYPERREE
jgi:hypothetical protein